MNKAIVAILIVLGLGPGLLLLHVSLNGYIADPAFFYSYATPSPNNKYLFVMLGPKAEPPNSEWRDENMEKSRQLQSKYAKSGLYFNDGSIKPLWEISEYSFKVIVPSDGVHLAAPAPWATTASDQALSFLKMARSCVLIASKILSIFPGFCRAGISTLIGSKISILMIRTAG